VSVRPSVALAMLLGLAMADMAPLGGDFAPVKRDEDEPEGRPRKPTHADEERIAAAQAKRERRAAKRRAQLSEAADQGERGGSE
jgi:hypothetical protein